MPSSRWSTESGLNCNFVGLLSLSDLFGLFSPPLPAPSWSFAFYYGLQFGDFICVRAHTVALFLVFFFFFKILVCFVYFLKRERKRMEFSEWGGGENLGGVGGNRKPYKKEGKKKE